MKDTKGRESIKKALRAGFTPKDIEMISQRDGKMSVWKKVIASCVRNVITKWEHSEGLDYPLKELDEIYSEFCAQSIGITSKRSERRKK